MRRTCNHVTRVGFGIGVAVLLAGWAVVPSVGAEILDLDIQGGAQMAGIDPFEGELVDEMPMIDNMPPQMAMQQINMGRRFRRGDYYTDDNLRYQIQQTLESSRDAGKDVWLWRDTVEERLVALGANAAGPLRDQIAQRDGYLRDALQVALFRLENILLRPNEALQTWAEHYFVLPSSNHPPCKVARVLDLGEAVDLRDLFPHHLFYILEYPRANQPRVVVALAADGMVQALGDDAALGRFIRNEAAFQPTQVGKERIAAAAALLAAARTTTIYKPNRLQVDGQWPTFTIALDATGLHQTLAATFNEQGRVETVSTGQEKAEVKPVAPVVVPARVAPPPEMPD
jgi:hypothetical protein